MFATLPTYTPTSSALTATLEDIYDPTIFNGAVQEAAIELNRFLESGIMANDAVIAAMATGAGSIGDLPFFHGINNNEPNYSTDNPGSNASTEGITSGKQTYAKAARNKGWSTMDLARELGLQDPMGAITNRIGKYWAVDVEKRLINSVMGVIADNVANDSGDLGVDVSIPDGDAATDPNLISAENVLDAKQTAGDHAEMFTVIAMHSVPYTRLQKLNLIDYIPDARGEVNIPTYLGYRVVVDDSLVPVPGGTSGFVYTTLLFAPGAVAYGSGTPAVPSEIHRKPESGDGGGQDEIWSRATDVIHPFGFAFDATQLTGNASATYAQLATATSWNRVYNERKNIGMAFLKTNG